MDQEPNLGIDLKVNGLGHTELATISIITCLSEASVWTTVGASRCETEDT